jgi:ABC-type nitrate/sulfonate/bicarbonate transport system permease component
LARTTLDPPRLSLRLPAGVRSVSQGWLLAAVLIVWEVVARANRTVFFPPLSTVLAQFGRDWFGSNPLHLFLSDQFWHTATPSLSRLARGWALAVVVGIAGGVAVARVRIVRLMYNPMIRFWMATPKVVLLPVALQVFGISDSLNIFLIFFGTVWLIMVNTADGVTGVDPMWLRSAQSMRLSRPMLYWRVIIPAASPQILAGMRVSIGVGLILMIISELYATTAGLGFQVLQQQETFQYVGMWSAFVLIAVIGILLNFAFALVEKRLLRWQRRRGLSDL